MSLAQAGTSWADAKVAAQGALTKAPESTRELTQSEDGEVDKHLEMWVIRSKRVWRSWTERPFKGRPVDWMGKREQEAERAIS
jgi:hypothetical protein